MTRLGQRSAAYALPDPSESVAVRPVAVRRPPRRYEAVRDAEQPWLLARLPLPMDGWRETMGHEQDHPYAELADGSVPGFTVRFTNADSAERRQVRRQCPSNVTDVRTVDRGRQDSGDVTVRFIGSLGTVWEHTNRYGRAERLANARRATRAARASTKRPGPKASCQCNDPREAHPDDTRQRQRCQARLRKGAQRERAAAHIADRLAANDT